MMNIPVCIKRSMFCIVMMPLYCCGQFFDDFSDGNFHMDPVWQGDENHFKVNNNLQLQLDDTQENTSCLFTSIDIFPAMEWHCFVRQAFSSSGNNHSRVYLSAASVCDTSPPDGIFLQLGEAGSDDAIRLMIQEDGDTSTLIRGSPGTIAGSFACFCKVVFEENLWQLFVDYDESGNYNYEGNTPGSINTGNAYLGIFCKYTVSNSSKFYFDDFYAGPIIYDTVAPEILSINVIGSNTLEIIFSEYIDAASGLNTQNYSLNHSMGNPQTLVFQGSGQDIVLASYPDSLIYGQLMQMSVENITDLSENLISPAVLDFAWYYPSRYDIIINEIMADPTPPQGLPEFEYLELYNTSPLPINLLNWSITLGTTEKVLSGPVIEAQDYIIVAKEEAVNDFSAYGTFSGLESFSLVNTGGDVVLSDQNGELIHSLSYNKGWYHDDERAEGGWSLEMINPYDPCLLSENWNASSHISGGTPGRINSAYDDLFLLPEIVNCCVLDSMRIQIVFNQSMHRNIGFDPGIFKIDHGIGVMEAVLPADPYFTSFILYPHKPLVNNTIYAMECRGKLCNCLGDSNDISDNIALGIPQKPAYNDIVINEVLFNPFPGGTDYLEIYNRSDKAISLKGLILASVKDNPPAPPDTDFVPINIHCNTIMPGEYVLLSESFDKINDYYDCRLTEKFLELGDFPSYSNDGGIILLLDENKNSLDAFSYSDEMQYPFLNNVEGVSLERIHYDRPASDNTNWHSASQLSGFGTPGYLNSQFSENYSEGGVFNIHPVVFTPGYDGISDHTNIRYELHKPGFLSTIMVFNASGQLCRHLVNNELLGTSGSYSWDGVDDNKQKVSAGIYIILAELIHPDGEVLRFKKTVIVAM